jgi:hypothetical protein
MLGSRANRRGRVADTRNRDAEAPLPRPRCWLKSGAVGRNRYGLEPRRGGELEPVWRIRRPRLGAEDPNSNGVRDSEKVMARFCSRQSANLLQASLDSGPRVRGAKSRVGLSGSVRGVCGGAKSQVGLSCSGRDPAARRALAGGLLQPILDLVPPTRPARISPRSAWHRRMPVKDGLGDADPAAAWNQLNT